MRSWRAWLGIAISALFLYFAFRGQDLGEIQAALGAADLAFLVPALFLYFMGIWVRALRWSVLLRPLVAVEGRQLLPIMAVGYMANNVLPLRTGELVRAYVLGRRFGVRKTAALATIAVERLFDGLTLLGFMLIATAFITFTSQLRTLALLAFGLFSVLLIGLFVLTLGGSLVDRLLQLVLGPMPTVLADRVERMAESFLSGLGVLRHRRDLALVAGSSLLAWLFEASMYWTLAQGFGGPVEEVMGIAATLLTTGVSNMATLIPSSPGYIGQFEYGVKLVLNGALGVPESAALAYAILVHVSLYVPITLWGVVEWSRQHLSLGEIREVEAEAEAEVDSGQWPVDSKPERALGDASQ